MKAASLLVSAAIAATAAPLAARPPAAPPMTPSQIDLAAGRTFDRIDRNHDGRVSLVELTSYGYSHRWGTSVREKKWRSLDSDHDGKVTREEFLAYTHQYYDRKR